MRDTIPAQMCLVAGVKRVFPVQVVKRRHTLMRSRIIASRGFSSGSIQTIVPPRPGVVLGNSESLAVSLYFGINYAGIHSWVIIAAPQYPASGARHA